MQKTDVLFFSILFFIIIFSSCSNNNDDRLLQENFAPAPPNGVLPIMTLTEVKGLERGCLTIIRTVIEGDQKVDLNAQYLEIQGTDDNCLILCQTQDPQFATWGGIVAGMSGSPVIIDGRIIGALAYGFSGTINPPYVFGVTPIEYMLALSNKKPAEDNLNEAMKAPAASGEIRFKPLAIPISITGQGRKANPVDFGDNTEVFFNPFNTMKADGKEGFSPGDTIAVNIVSGPICNVDAHGTITYVDGNNIYAFGHSMFQNGNANLPFRKSWVHKIISSSNTPFKFSSGYGDILGVINKDFSTGIEGETGGKSDAIPVQVCYVDPDGKTKTATHFVARGQEWAVGEVLSSCVSTWRDEKSPGTAKVYMEVSFKETSKKFQRDYFFTGEDPYEKIYDDLCGTLFNKGVIESFSNRAENYVAKATIDNIYINVTDLSDIMSAEIVSLKAPKNVKIGETFEIEVGYKPYRKPVAYLKYSLDVPAWFHLSSATLSMSTKAGQYIKKEEFIPNDLDGYIDKISKDFIPLNVGLLKLSAYYGQEVTTKDILTPWVISGSKELEINITK